MTGHRVPLLLLLVSSGFISLAQADCIQSFGVDPSFGESHADVRLGEAVGQTFYAENLLIQSITVWRDAQQDTNQFGMRIFVTKTDSLTKPDVSQVLAIGPDVFHLFGDGINPTEFKFVFDPPLMLPGAGTYYFAIQSVPCWGFWQILSTGGIDRYPNGHVWLNGKNDECQVGPYLRPFPQSYPAADLCFRIQYCNETTPTKRHTWGQLKVLYR